MSVGVQRMIIVEIARTARSYRWVCLAGARPFYRTALPSAGTR